MVNYTGKLIQAGGWLLALDGAFSAINRAAKAWKNNSGENAQDRLAAVVEEVSSDPSDVAEAGFGSVLAGINLKKKVGL